MRVTTIPLFLPPPYCGQALFLLVLVCPYSLGLVIYYGYYYVCRTCFSVCCVFAIIFSKFLRNDVQGVSTLFLTRLLLGKRKVRYVILINRCFATMRKMVME